MPAASVVTAAIDLASRPRRADGVDVARRPDDDAILLQREGRFVQISAPALEIWNALDGVSDLRELATQPPAPPGPERARSILALTKTLADCGFVEFDGKRAEAPERVTELGAYLTFSPERAVHVAYRVFGRFFSWWSAVACATIALAGVLTFFAVPHRVAAHGGRLGLWVALAFIGAMLAHEAGHALTLRHFGGSVRRAGLGWYWFAPTAFVDTSDAYALPRAQRIAVCIAGPAIDLVIAGIAAMAAAVSRDATFATAAWMFAGAVYVAVLCNLNPLLELDGYYVLTDLLARPNLRSDGFAMLFSRRRCDRVTLAYGAGAIAYAAAFVVFIVPALVRTALAAWPLPAQSLATIAWLPALAGFAAAIVVCVAILRVRLHDTNLQAERFGVPGRDVQ